MDLDLHKSGEVQVLHLRGNLKLGDGVDQFKSVIENLGAQGDVRVVVNLSQIVMADSSGIGALVRAQSSMKPKGGAVKLVSPSRLVLQTLKILGLLSVFELYDDDQSAVESF
ncbi:MAG TPA: STAS domain-containing protein [Terriglobales bacterium]|nr:STAS domain-containing protein [Terriglobales bacterium]